MVTETKHFNGCPISADNNVHVPNAKSDNLYGNHSEEIQHDERLVHLTICKDKITYIVNLKQFTFFDRDGDHNVSGLF